MTGAYEMNFGYMQYCTGIGQADIITTLEKFQQDRKIAYVDGYVVLLNHLKYQNYSKGNENQQKAFEREKSLLSDSVRDFIDNKGESTSPQLVGNQLPTIHKSEIRNKKTKNIKQKTEIINSEIEKSFEEFWEVYPRKIKKQDAKEKYVLLVGQDNTLVDKILKGLNEQLPTMEKQERQFIPHPTTWLNGRRWEDVVEEKGGGKWI